MISHQKVQGIFIARTWDQRAIEKLLKHDIPVTAANLYKEGFNPESEQIQKNSITSDGLDWIYGQILGEDKWGSKLGEMALADSIGNELSTTDQTINYSRKQVVLSRGSTRNTFVQDAYWDTTEVNSVEIYGMRLYTITDASSPAGAYPFLYAVVSLGSNYIYKDTVNPRSLTVTRYETLSNS